MNYYLHKYIDKKKKVILFDRNKCILNFVTRKQVS